MVDFSQVKLFEKEGRTVTYQDLLQDIYESNEESKETMRLLVGQLVGLVDSPAAAVALMEHINNLMNSKIKNDDILVKIASIMSRIIQKGMNETTSGDDWGIDEDEKKRLLAEAEAYLDKSKDEFSQTTVAKKR